MGYYHPVAKKGNQADLARQYGVKGVSSPRPGMEGGALPSRRSINQVEQEISAAMANDYSTREFLKYNEDARKKMKNGLPSSRKQNTALYEMMQEAHKDDGNGGKFSNAVDRAGVAQSAFEDYMSQYQIKSKGNKQEIEPEKTKDPAVEKTVYSPQIQQAKERAQNYEQGTAAEEDDKVFKASNAFIDKQHDFSKKEFTG